MASLLAFCWRHSVLSRTTHFEQVPIAVVKAIVERQIQRDKVAASQHSLEEGQTSGLRASELDRRRK